MMPMTAKTSQRKARLEQLEPMEVVQFYVNRYLGDGSSQRASSQYRTACFRSYHRTDRAGQKILDNGYAYESEGSVYFDVEKYNKDHNYGVLSVVTLR